MESHTSGKAVSAEIKFDLTSTLDAVQKSFESDHKAGIKQVTLDDSISYHYHLNIKPLIDSLKGKDEIAINNAFRKFFAEEGLVSQLASEKILDTQACKSYINVLEFYRLCSLFESLQLTLFKEDSIESSSELKEAPVTLAAIQNKIVEDNIVEYKSYLSKWSESPFSSFPSELKAKISVTKEKLKDLKYRIEIFEFTESKVDTDTLLMEREKSLAIACQKVNELQKEYEELNNERIQLEHEEDQFFSSLKQKEIKHCLPLQHVPPIILENQVLKGTVELKQAQREYDKRSIKLTAIAKLVEQIDTLMHESIDTFLESYCKSLKKSLIQARKSIMADSPSGEDATIASERGFDQNIEKIRSGFCQMIQDKFTREVKLFQKKAISERETKLSAYISQIQSGQDAASLNIETSHLVDQWNEAITNLNLGWKNEIARVLEPFQAEYKAIDPQSTDITEKSADDLLRRARRALNDFLQGHPEVNLLEASRKQEINNVVQQAWGIFSEDLKQLKSELNIKDFVQSQHQLVREEVKAYEDLLQAEPLERSRLAELKNDFYKWREVREQLALSQCITKNLPHSLVSEIMQPAIEFSSRLQKIKSQPIYVSLPKQEKLPGYSGWWAAFWFFVIPVIGYCIYEWWYNRKRCLVLERNVTILEEARNHPESTKSQGGSRSSSRQINIDLGTTSPHGANNLADLKHADKREGRRPIVGLDLELLTRGLTTYKNNQDRAGREAVRKTSLTPEVREHYLSPAVRERLSPFNKLKQLTHSMSSPGGNVTKDHPSVPFASAKSRHPMHRSLTSGSS
jgi:hypothetical protein